MKRPPTTRTADTMAVLKRLSPRPAGRRMIRWEGAGVGERSFVRVEAKVASSPSDPGGPKKRSVPSPTGLGAGVALVSIGILMISPITKLDFDDYTELVPAFLTIVLMSFTYNVGVGMTTGLLVYPLLKLMTGRVREVPPALWVLAAMSAVFFVVYPYR